MRNVSPDELQAKLGTPMGGGTPHPNRDSPAPAKTTPPTPRPGSASKGGRPANAADIGFGKMSGGSVEKEGSSIVSSAGTRLVAGMSLSQKEMRDLEKEKEETIRKVLQEQKEAAKKTDEDPSSEEEKKKTPPAKEDKWEPSISVSHVYLKKNGVYSVVHLGYKQFSFKAQINRLRSELVRPVLLDLDSNKLKDLDETKYGYMEPNCIPWHIMAVLCLIRGTAVGTEAFSRTYQRWEDAKSIAMSITDAQDDEEVKKEVSEILKKAVARHSSTAFNKYHNLVFLNNQSGLCYFRGMIIKDWMGVLKYYVEEETNKYAAEVSEEMHRVPYEQVDGVPEIRKAIALPIEAVYKEDD